MLSASSGDQVSFNTTVGVWWGFSYELDFSLFDLMSAKMKICFGHSNQRDCCSCVGRRDGAGSFAALGSAGSA